jgi:hypothetical protein
MSTGMGLITDPHRECVLCSGSGLSDKKQCPVCLGWGCVAFGEPIVACPECDGPPSRNRGRANCRACGGTGWFFPLKSPLERERDGNRPQSSYSLARPELC